MRKVNHLREKNRLLKIDTSIFYFEMKSSFVKQIVHYCITAKVASSIIRDFGTYMLVILEGFEPA
jgi:hypothetical protein